MSERRPGRCARAAGRCAGRRYGGLPNFVRSRGAERLLIEEVGLTHPLTGIQLSHRDGIANAFDWSPEPRTIEAKYTDGVQDMKRLYEEVAGSMAGASPRAKDYTNGQAHSAVSA